MNKVKRNFKRKAALGLRSGGAPCFPAPSLNAEHFADGGGGIASYDARRRAAIDAMEMGNAPNVSPLPATAPAAQPSAQPNIISRGIDSAYRGFQTMGDMAGKAFNYARSAPARIQGMRDPRSFAGLRAIPSAMTAATRPAQLAGAVAPAARAAGSAVAGMPEVQNFMSHPEVQNQVSQLGTALAPTTNALRAGADVFSRGLRGLYADGGSDELDNIMELRRMPTNLGRPIEAASEVTQAPRPAASYGDPQYADQIERAAPSGPSNNPYNQPRRTVSNPLLHQSSDGAGLTSAFRDSVSSPLTPFDYDVLSRSGSRPDLKLDRTKLRYAYGGRTSRYNETGTPTESEMAGGGMHRGPGEVEGPGGPREDRVPAMLSDDEYVLPAKTVFAMGGARELDKIVMATNDGREPVGARERRGLRDGGNVYHDEGNTQLVNEPYPTYLGGLRDGGTYPVYHEEVATRPLYRTTDDKYRRYMYFNVGGTQISPFQPVVSLQSGGDPFEEYGPTNRRPPPDPYAEFGPEARTSPLRAEPAGQSAARNWWARARGATGEALSRPWEKVKGAGKWAGKAATPVAGTAGAVQSLGVPTETMQAESSDIGGKFALPGPKGERSGLSRSFAQNPFLGPIGMALGAVVDPLLATRPNEREAIRDLSNRAAGTSRRVANIGTWGASEAALEAAGVNPLGGKQPPAAAPSPEAAPVNPTSGAPVAPQEVDPLQLQTEQDAADFRLHNQLMKDTTAYETDPETGVVTKTWGLRNMPQADDATNMPRANMMFKMRGDPITVDRGESGELRFSGSGPSNRIYMGADGQPTRNYEDTAQYQGGLARAAKDKSDLNDLVAGYAAEGDFDRASQLATTGAHRKVIEDARLNQRRERDIKRKFGLRGEKMLSDERIAATEAAARHAVTPYQQAALDMDRQRFGEQVRSNKVTEAQAAANARSVAARAAVDDKRAADEAEERFRTARDTQREEWIGKQFPDGKGGYDKTAQDELRFFANAMGPDLYRDPETGRKFTGSEANEKLNNILIMQRLSKRANEKGGLFGSTVGGGPDRIVGVRSVRPTEDIIGRGGLSAPSAVFGMLPLANDYIVITESGQKRRLTQLAAADGKYNRDEMNMIAKLAGKKVTDLFHKDVLNR